MINRLISKTDLQSTYRSFSLVICVVFLSPGVGAAQQTAATEKIRITEAKRDVELQRQAAIVKAIKRVEGSIVRLETFSPNANSPKIGSGFIVDEGYLVTSSFFVRSPKAKVFIKGQNAAIPLSIVGTDFSRNLTYLKLNENSLFPLPIRLKREIQVGETVIAIGRTLSSESVNVSLGIVSAKNRIQGKAIQTDAKVSPTNYGGPLVDLNGEIVGALVALSPDSSDIEAGAQWYDSGIGFAIPIMDVQKSLDMVRKLASESSDSSQRADLFPGRLGVRFSVKNIYSDSLIVSLVLPRSPASEAGVRPGALVTKVNEKPVSRLAQFQSELGQTYAGETLTLHLRQDGKTSIANCMLVKSISPFRYAYLGILPDGAHRGDGIKVLRVDKSSFANRILSRGDIIRKLNGITIDSGSDVENFFSQVESGQTVSVEFESGGVDQKAMIRLGELTKPISDDVFGEFNFDKAGGPLVQTEIRVAGLPNRCIALSPSVPKILGESSKSNGKSPTQRPPYQPSRAIVWLPETNDVDFAKVSKKWKDVLQRQNAVLLIPLPNNIKGWSDDEREFVWKATRAFLRQQPKIDHRMIYFGGGKAAEICLKLVNERRESAIGMILSDPDFKAETILPYSDPQNRLLVKCLLSRERSILEDSLQQAFQNNSISIDISAADDSVEFSSSDILGLEPWLMLLNRL